MSCVGVICCFRWGTPVEDSERAIRPNAFGHSWKRSKIVTFCQVSRWSWPRTTAGRLGAFVRHAVVAVALQCGVVFLERLVSRLDEVDLGIVIDPVRVVTILAF